MQDKIPVYMKGHDYMNALITGRFLILSVIVLSCLTFAVYAFMTYQRSSVSVVLRTGAYIGEAGTITPVLKAEEIREIVNTGVLNGLVARKTKLESEKLSKIVAVNPGGTDIIQISLETEKSSEGLIVLNELVSQFESYLEQKRNEKLKTVSAKYLDSLKAQLAALELSKLKKSDELKSALYEYAQLQKAVAVPSQDKMKAAEQIRTKTELVRIKQKELGNIDLDINNLRKQVTNLSDFAARAKTIQVIQEPLATSRDFIKRFLNNLFVVGVGSLAFGIILQFIIYDLKLGGRSSRIPD